MSSRFQRGLWRLHSFRLLMSASMVSIFGSMITATAFPFIAIAELDAGPAQIAILSLAQIAPSVILGSFAGLWIDRLSRRKIMIASDIASATALTIIPVAYWTDRLSLLLLVCVALVMSLARLCFRIADRSILPQIVARDQIEEANATLSGGSAISEAAGFSVGGVLVQVLSGPVALAVDAISFVSSALLLRQLPDPPPTREELNEDGIAIVLSPRHWKHELMDGLRFLRNSPILSPLAISIFMMSIGVETTGTVYFIFVNETVGFTPGALGFIFATGGIGSLIGAALSTEVTARFGAGVAIAGSLLLLGLSSGAITLASSVGPFALGLLLGQQLGDAFWLYYESTSTSIRQLNAPEEMLGRVNGAFENIEFAGLLLGAGLGALIGETIGLRATLLTGSGLVALASLPILLTPVRSIKNLTEG